MSDLFHTILYQPLFNALVFLYSNLSFQDLGVAIILLTIIIRLILYPLFYKLYKNQAVMRKIQPEIKKIQEKHKGSRENQAKEMMALYRASKINPFSGFFLILIQLPILLALYQVFQKGLSEEAFADLYGFIAKPEVINGFFLGLIDLAKPAIVIIGLAAIAQYIQGKMSLAKIGAKGKTGELSAIERAGRQMVFIAPILTIIVLSALPSAVGVYWFMSAIFSIGQQALINRMFKKAEEKNGTDSNPSQKNI